MLASLRKAAHAGLRAAAAHTHVAVPLAAPPSFAESAVRQGNTLLGSDDRLVLAHHCRCGRRGCRQNWRTSAIIPCEHVGSAAATALDANGRPDQAQDAAKEDGLHAGGNGNDFRDPPLRAGTTGRR